MWNSVVVRGDGNYVRIKAFANLQDKVVVSTARFLEGGVPAHVIIGRHTSVGPLSVLRSCVVENEVMIGERCVVQEGSVVESGSRLAPGTVVPPNTLIPGGSLYAGNPCAFVRALTYDEKAEHVKLAEQVSRVADVYASQFTPTSPIYIQAEKLRAEVGDRLGAPQS